MTIRTLLVAFVLLLTSPAIGQGPEARRCSAIFALEQFSSHERSVLEALCHRGDAGPRPGVDETIVLDTLTQRLLLEPGWVSGSFASLLPSAAFEEGRSSAECETTAAKTAYEKDLRQALIKYVETRARGVDDSEGEPTTPAAFYFDHSARRSCRLMTERAGKDESRGVLLTVFAQAGEAIRLQAGGDRPVRIQLSEHRFTDGAAVFGDRAVYFARVPSRAHYVVTSHAKRQDGTLKEARALVLRADVATFSQPIWADIGRPECLNVRIAASSDAELYIDGARAALPRTPEGWSGIEWVEKVPHRVTVIERAPGTQAVRILLNRDIEPHEGLTENVCHSVLHDLTSRGTRNILGVLSVDASQCVQAGLDSAKLDAYLRTYLKRHNISARHLAAWGSAADEVATLRRTFDQLGGKPVGADRGRMDSAAGLATGAQELLRQGFASLLRLRLICSSGGPGFSDYSAIAERVDLQKLYDRARDPLTGVDLTNILTSEITVITRRDLIAQGVDTSLARVFDQENLALQRASFKQAFHAKLEIPVEVRIPRREAERRHSVAISFMPLSTERSADVCRRVKDTGSLRSQADFRDLDLSAAWRAGSSVRIDTHGEDVSTIISIDPTSTRTLLIRGTLLRRDAAGKDVPVVQRYACADLSLADHEAWVDLGLWINSGFSSAAHREASTRVHLLGGFDWKQSYWEKLSLGLALGYSHTERKGQSPPSWNDLSPQTRFSRSGDLSYSLSENAAYVGISARARGTVCEILYGSICSPTLRRSFLGLRALLMLGVHFVDKTGIPETLADFRGDEVTVVPDALAFLQLYGAYEIDAVRSLRLGVGYGTHRMLDHFVRSDASANVDRRGLLALSLGVTWGL